MSAVALMGSLAGSGTFKLENGRVVRLDPAAFDAVMRAVDQGLPIDVNRVRDRTDAALASGVLPVALAEGAITINAGQARLSDVTVRAQRADLAVSGSVNLADAALEGRLTLFGMGGASAPAQYPAGNHHRAERAGRYAQAQHRRCRARELARVARRGAAIEEARGARRSRSCRAALCARGPRQFACGQCQSENDARAERAAGRCCRAGSGAHRAGGTGVPSGGATRAGDTERAEAKTRRAYGRPCSGAPAADRHPAGADTAGAARGWNAWPKSIAAAKAGSRASTRAGTPASALAVGNIVRQLTGAFFHQC